MSLIKNIKRKINTGNPISLSDVIAEVVDYDIVSFDIFDTLLKRNVYEPIDVFNYMEKKLNIDGFAEKRIKAEVKARDKRKKGEVTLEDIYQEMDINLSKEEMFFESELLIANKEMLPIYNWCIEHKRVILISDMYLSEQFIETILKREGISGYLKIYVSSTHNKMKRNGELYKYVLNDVGDKKIIHIGDSIKADYIMPRKYGIHSIHIPTYTPISRCHVKDDSLDSNILNSFLNNTSIIGEDDYYRFGYEKFGMFLWGFSKWLHECLVKEGLKKVYFFSRDGYVMKTVFDEMYKDIDTFYLEVSRRSLRVPLLWLNYEFEYVINMLSPSKLISISSFFDGVGLDITKYNKLLMKYGFTEETVFDRSNIYCNNNLKCLYDEIVPDILTNSKYEYDLLVKYLKQNELDDRIAVVDIGWAGSMQRYLCQTLNQLGLNIKIKGYYIGIAGYYKKNEDFVDNNDIKGYLFDFAHDSFAKDLRSPFVGLLETLFLEQAGSVCNYSEINGVIIANRLPYEYIENDKETYESKNVKKIQEGALDFIRGIKKFQINLPATVLFSGIERTGISPRKKDIDMFANFRFSDEGDFFELAGPNSLIYYIMNPRKLKNDFLSSRWKIGFMKRIFKINLPYKRLYELLLKLK